MSNVHEQGSHTNFTSLIWRKFLKHRVAVFSLCVLIFFAFLSLMAPGIEAFLQVSHKTASLSQANLPSSWPHVLGTNELGQDVFTRLIFGGRVSLSVGFLAALTSAIIGSVIGLVAGYYGGWVDAILMRFTDAMLSIPVLPLMIIFSALDLPKLVLTTLNYERLLLIYLIILGFFIMVRFIKDSGEDKREKAYLIRMLQDGVFVSILFFIFSWVFCKLILSKEMTEGNFASVVKLIVIIVFFGWMTVARLARASALQLKNLDFIMAARSLGASHTRIILVHIFPHALAPIIVAATLEVGSNILYEAALSFLGLGIQPPVSSWGNMLNNAVEYVKLTPSLAFWPGLFILVTVACFNFLGDGMRDALDPHQVINRAPKN